MTNRQTSDGNVRESEDLDHYRGTRSHQFAIKASEWALANGSPEKGWEKAHTPLPQDLGDEWVWLPHDLHQIHGLLQSVDLNRTCYWAGDAKRFLSDSLFCLSWFELWDIYDRYHNKRHFTREASIRGGSNGRSSHKDAVKAGRTGKTWELTSPKGEVCVTNRLLDFCNSRGLNASNIRQVAYGNRRHHLGYIARIIDPTHT